MIPDIGISTLFLSRRGRAHFSSAPENSITVGPYSFRRSGIGSSLSSASRAHLIAPSSLALSLSGT
ncbi:J domain-containing protein [Psidium guajava]|nr:J domain-containing protein [Psidium guajava]